MRPKYKLTKGMSEEDRRTALDALSDAIWEALKPFGIDGGPGFSFDIKFQTDVWDDDEEPVSVRMVEDLYYGPDPADLVIE